MTTVREAIATLLGVCDGAVQNDGQGFNGFDSPRARSMYARNPWTPLVEQAAHEMLRKYRSQLSGYDISYKALKFETSYDGQKITVVPARVDIRDAKNTPSADRPSGTKRATENNVVTYKDGVFRLVSSYSFKDTAKSLYGGRWNAQLKTWDYVVNPSTAQGILAWAESGKVSIGPKALEKAEKVCFEYAEDPLKCKAKYGLFPSVWHENNKFFFRGPYSSLELAKSIPQARWDKETKLWNYPPILPVAEKVRDLAADGEVYLKKTAKKALQSIISQHDTQTEAIDLLKHGELIKVDVPLKGTLMDHQHRAYNISTSVNASGLLMEQGTGKTLSALCVAGHRYLEGQVKRLLVVCPLSVGGTWEKEFAKFADFPVKVFNLTAVKGKNRAQLAQKAINYKGKELTVLVVNYESVWETTKKGKKLRVHSYVKDFKPQMGILDESHRIKKHTTKQARALFKLRDRMPYRMILTGTPVTQSPLDFFSQFMFLDPTIFGTNYYAFRNEYARMGGYMNKEIIGYKNLGQLAHKAHSICYRVSKKECLDLPDEMDQTIFVPLEGDQKKYYHQMVKDSIIMLSETDGIVAPLAITQMMRLQQITGGMVPMFNIETGEKTGEKWIGSAKAKALEEFLDTAPPDKKFVVFARFRPELDEIERIFHKLGRKAVKLDGRFKGNRQDLVDQFQNDPEVTGFVAQIKTGGIGLTLIAADTAIFYSTTFSYEEYGQAKARIHRIGQKNKVTYLHLVVENTIDEGVLEVLRTKGDISELVVDVLKKGARDMKVDGNTKDLQARMAELKQRIDKEGRKKTRVGDMPAVDEPIVVKEKKKKKFQSSAPTAEEGVKQKKASVRESHGDEEIISLKDLAEELEVEPKEIRKKLRKLPGFDKSGGRWEWSTDDPQLAKIRAMWAKKGRN